MLKMIKLKNTVKILSAYAQGNFLVQCLRYSSDEPEVYPLRSRKKKSNKTLSKALQDSHIIKTVGGKGGDGCISFLQAFANDKAGPDGGNGGHGGHVIFKASESIKDFSHLSHVVKANDGEKGYNKDCAGKNAKHYFVDVPIGTIVKTSNGTIVGDLDKEGMMFVAARGGCGGKGNHFFTTDTNQAPEVAEIGATGELFSYILEMKSMAHFGLVGLPNAGKSTLLRAISRARPEVAGYEFTTLRPYVGVVTFSDYEQIYVADLPGLIEGSHQNKGLGIQFLKHTERCLGLLYIIDMSRENPLSQLDTLMHELSSFSNDLSSRPSILVANKMDLEEAQDNLRKLERETDHKFIPISAKMGKNLLFLLRCMRKMYDDHLTEDKSRNDEENIP